MAKFYVDAAVFIEQYYAVIVLTDDNGNPLQYKCIPNLPKKELFDITNIESIGIGMAIEYKYRTNTKGIIYNDNQTAVLAANLNNIKWVPREQNLASKFLTKLNK